MMQGMKKDGSGMIWNQKGLEIIFYLHKNKKSYLLHLFCNITEEGRKYCVRDFPSFFFVHYVPSQRSPFFVRNRAENDYAKKLLPIHNLMRLYTLNGKLEGTEK